MVVLVMGVAGSGKTTVGRALAQALGWSFADADDFHSPANIAKMAAGKGLNDNDRAPWLAALRRYIDDGLDRGRSSVLACSALKASYRAALIADGRSVRVVYLHASPTLIKARLAQRTGHFMRAGMAESQFATLEPPVDALTLDAGRPPAELVDEVRRAFGI